MVGRKKFKNVYVLMAIYTYSGDNAFDYGMLFGRCNNAIADLQQENELVRVSRKAVIVSLNQA